MHKPGILPATSPAHSLAGPSASLIRGNNGGTHHDLAIAAGGGENRPAARLEPAVQSAFFAGGSATTRAAPLQSRVPNGGVIASK